MDRANTRRDRPESCYEGRPFALPASHAVGRSLSVLRTRVCCNAGMKPDAMSFLLIEGYDGLNGIGTPILVMPLGVGES